MCLLAPTLGFIPLATLPGIPTPIFGQIVRNETATHPVEATISDNEESVLTCI